MDSMEVEAVVRKVFQLSDEDSLEGVGPGTIPQWDSLGHVSLITAVEKAFDIQFEVEEIALIDSLDSLKKVMKNHVS